MTETATKELIDGPVKRDMTIGDVVAKYPAATEVMLKYGLHCVGCHVNAFETLEQGINGHGMPETVLVDMLNDINSAVKNEPVTEKHDPKEDKPVGIELTESAVKKIKELRESEEKPGHALKVSAVKGGCAGFSYEMEFLEKPEADDDVIAGYPELTVFYSRSAAEQLSGVSIDYRESLQDSGFVMKNPNAEKGCSCGKSFS